MNTSRISYSTGGLMIVSAGLGAPWWFITITTNVMREWRSPAEL